MSRKGKNEDKDLWLAIKNLEGRLAKAEVEVEALREERLGTPDAVPRKLSDGEWGVEVYVKSQPQIGSRVRVSTLSGRTWWAFITQVEGYTSSVWLCRTAKEPPQDCPAGGSGGVEDPQESCTSADVLELSDFRKAADTDSGEKSPQT